MKFWLSGFLIAFGLSIAGAAAQAAAPSASCTQAAATAGAAVNLPDNLLLAIGMVESGWTNPATGKRAPWPYSVNADGKGYWFPDAEAAIDFVRLARGSGARAIDVGCFQIDLQDHPDAFTTLKQAFDPQANARYAASFLNRLHARLGSWSAAIAGYHSQTPSLGLPYERRVLASWHGASVPLEAIAVRSDPYVIRVAQFESGGGNLPHIITP